MKKNNLSKLGKALLEIELSKDPFSMTAFKVSVKALNERFDLNRVFDDSTEKVVPIKDSMKYKSTRFFCFGTLLGLLPIFFDQRKTFVDAIAELKNSMITQMMIMPSHLVCETFISNSDMAKVGLYVGSGSQTVNYEIYYLHPDQREAIYRTVLWDANPITEESVSDFAYNHLEFPADHP
jgi:hypothetical protein